MAQKYQANKAKLARKYEKNKDLILQQRKKYYASQKEKILLQKKQYYKDKKAVRENRLFILEFQNLTIVWNEGQNINFIFWWIRSSVQRRSDLIFKINESNEIKSGWRNQDHSVTPKRKEKIGDLKNKNGISGSRNSGFLFVQFPLPTTKKTTAEPCFSEAGVRWWWLRKEFSSQWKWKRMKNCFL